MRTDMRWESTMPTTLDPLVLVMVAATWLACMRKWWLAMLQSKLTLLWTQSTQLRLLQFIHHLLKRISQGRLHLLHQLAFFQPHVLFHAHVPFPVLQRHQHVQ